MCVIFLFLFLFFLWAYGLASDCHKTKFMARDIIGLPNDYFLTWDVITKTISKQNANAIFDKNCKI